MAIGYLWLSREQKNIAKRYASISLQKRWLIPFLLVCIVFFVPCRHSAFVVDYDLFCEMSDSFMIVGNMNCPRHNFSLNRSTTSSRQTYGMKIFHEWTFPREHCTPMKRSNCDKREIILGGNLIVPCGVTKEHQNLINTRFWDLATFSPGFHSAFSLILKNMFIFSMKKSKTRKQKLHTPPEARTLQSLRSKDSEVSARPGQEDGMNMMLLLCNMHGFQTYSGQKGMEAFMFWPAL